MISDEMIIGAILMALLVGAFTILSLDEKKWDEFKTEHKCVVVGKISGDVIPTYGIGANGNMTFGVGFTDDKTGWKCDDGITYYR